MVAPGTHPHIKRRNSDDAFYCIISLSIRIPKMGHDEKLYMLRSLVGKAGVRPAALWCLFRLARLVIVAAGMLNFSPAKQPGTSSPGEEQNA